MANRERLRIDRQNEYARQRREEQEKAKQRELN